MPCSGSRGLGCWCTVMREEYFRAIAQARGVFERACRGGVLARWVIVFDNERGTHFACFLLRTQGGERYPARLELRSPPWLTCARQEAGRKVSKPTVCERKNRLLLASGDSLRYTSSWRPLFARRWSFFCHLPCFASFRVPLILKQPNLLEEVQKGRITHVCTRHLCSVSS
jgi:hypothetical protein